MLNYDNVENREILLAEECNVTFLARYFTASAYNLRLCYITFVTCCRT